MRLMLAAALGAALLAGTGGAVEGWRHSPDTSDGTSGYWAMVATHLPTGSPVFVTPECTLDMMNTLKSVPPAPGTPVASSAAPREGGPIPAGFVAVRAVRCLASGDSNALTVTQSELRDPAAVKNLVRAYRTTHVQAYVSSREFCPAMAESYPDLALVNAEGVAVKPEPARDDCGFMVPAVRTALENGPWTVTKSVTIHGAFVIIQENSPTSR